MFVFIIFLAVIWFGAFNGMFEAPVALALSFLMFGVTIWADKYKGAK